MSVAQNITRAYGGDWHGSYGCFPSPGHDKVDRGMTVKDADSGNDVVFHSYNGGDWRAVKDECRQRGLLPERPRANANCDRKLRTNVAGAWEYTDERGVTLYRKVRLALPNGGKSYRFEHPDGRGGWKPKRGDAPQVPYRLPDILAAEHSAVLYMAEGEKQADKLAGWGFLATSHKDWLPAFGRHVAGRTIIILPDNDDDGRDQAAKAKAKVEAAGGRAVLLTLPGLPDKGDVMDWRGTADELRALTEAALSEPAETFELADLSLWASTTPTPKAFVMAPFIPRDDVVIVTGDGGTNKSTLALQISACAASGRQMLGMNVAPGPALYITAEDDNRENHWRLSKIASSIGTTLHDLAGKLHVVSLRGQLNNELATFDQDGRLRTAPAYALLRATIAATKAKLVTLDNVAHLFAGNENDRSQVTAFINLLYQLCGDMGVTILLIAHRNKAGDSYSGSTAWLNAVRSQVLLERSDEADADVRKMSLGKANYARAGEEVTFRWHDFALVRDKDLPTDMRAEIAAVARANADDTTFLKCLDERNRQGRAVSESKASRTYAPKEFAEMVESKGVGRTRLEAAMDRLYRVGAIERGVVGRHQGEGKDMIGVRRTSDDLSDDVPMTPSDDMPITTRRPPMAHTPYTTYIPGAAHEAAAPSREEGEGRKHTPPIFTAEHPNGRSRGGPILAPEDIEDGGKGGLEGWGA